MKRLASIVFLMCALWAKADCASDGISFFPTSATIAANSIFVIGTYGNSQKIIPELGKKYKIYLQSGDEKINLVTVEILVGRKRITQAVLKAQTPLTPGETYRLIIENITPFEVPKRKNAANDLENFSYTVLSTPDLEKPTLTTGFKEIKKQYQMFGCGDAVNVIFNCPVKDSSEFLVKATVKNLVTGVTTTYYLEPQKNAVSVGYDICSGAFTYGLKAEKHQVQFAVMDASGNITQTGKPIFFTNPTFENNLAKSKKK
jgi:hypothetical protein